MEEHAEAIFSLFLVGFFPIKIFWVILRRCIVLYMKLKKQMK